MSRPTNETGLVKRISQAIKEKYGDEALVYKIHGGPMQEAGIPDLLLCVRGRYIGLEVKFQRPGESAQHAIERTTAIQLRQLERIRAAGGGAWTVLNVQDALNLIALHIASEGAVYYTE